MVSLERITAPLLLIPALCLDTHGIVGCAAFHLFVVLPILTRAEFLWLASPGRYDWSSRR